MKVKIERLKEVLSYDPDTGVFTWIKSLAPRGKVGCEAGAINKDGYRVIRIDGVQNYAHRLAILLSTGKAPVGLVDHIDGNKSNNSFANLRVVSAAQNTHNSRSYGKTSSYKGVSWDSRRGKWSAQLTVNGVKVLSKRFDSEREAAEEFLFSALEHQGEHARAL